MKKEPIGSGAFIEWGSTNSQRLHSDPKSGAPKVPIPSFGGGQRTSANWPPCEEKPCHPLIILLVNVGLLGVRVFDRLGELDSPIQTVPLQERTRRDRVTFDLPECKNLQKTK